MKRNIAKFAKRQNGLLTAGQHVIEKMESNPVFPDPPAALAELKKVLPAFQAALVYAESRDKQMVSIKHDKKAIVLTLLQELAGYVTAICKGDRTQILSSGFDVTSESRSGGSMPPSIEKLEVTLGLPGEATTRSKRAKGAKAYAHQYTTQPPGLHPKEVRKLVILSKDLFQKSGTGSGWWPSAILDKGAIHRLLPWLFSKKQVIHILPEFFCALLLLHPANLKAIQATYFTSKNSSILKVPDVTFYHHLFFCCCYGTPK